MSGEEMTGRELTPIYVEADIRVDIRHKTFHVYLSEDEAGEISAAIDREVRKALPRPSAGWTAAATGERRGSHLT